MVFNHALANLSDNVLLSRLHKLVKNEKQTTLSILLHLAEVDRRDLYLGYGFSSLFDYCVGALGYSRSAAGRRIASARCLRRFPEVYDLLESGEVNLTTIGHIASILDDENKNLLLREIRGKTERQVEAMVARYKPPVAYRDRVRPVRVVVPELGQNPKNSRNPLILNSRSGSSPFTGGLHLAAAAGTSAPDHQANHTDTNRANGSEGVTGAHACSENPGGAGKSNGSVAKRSRIERRLLIQFLANEEFMAKLDEVKALLSNKMPNGTFESVFDALMNEFIDRHSPAKRTQRREKRCAKKLEKQNEKHAGKCSSKSAPKRVVKRAEQRDGKRDAAKQPKDNGTANKSHAPRETKTTQKRTRHIPASIRDKVFARDNARCSYVGKNGKRCGSTHNLQIDHIKPFARGGLTTLSNLRLLCGKHNRHEAKRILGIDVMNQYTKRE